MEVASSSDVFIYTTSKLNVKIFYNYLYWFYKIGGVIIFHRSQKKVELVDFNKHNKVFFASVLFLQGFRMFFKYFL